MQKSGIQVLEEEIDSQPTKVAVKVPVPDPEGGIQVKRAAKAEAAKAAGSNKPPKHSFNHSRL